MIANSVAVILIGLLLARAVSRTAPTIAAGYLVSRVAEAVLLAVGVTFTLLLAHPFAGPGSAARDVGLAVGDTAYQLAMISLALGSVPFFVLLVRLRAIHPVVAWWGAAGYALLLLGATLDLAGVPAGLALSLPGGLFEVAFAVILLVRGFGPLAATPVPAHAHGSSLPVA
jgi:Domain of unknown function (DUF4386)